MTSLVAFSPAATRPCAAAAPITSRSINAVVPRAGRAAHARASSVVASLVRSPRQQLRSSSSSSVSPFERRSKIQVIGARDATAATSSLPPLLPFDGKKIKAERASEKREREVFLCLLVRGSRRRAVISSARRRLCGISRSIFWLKSVHCETSYVYIPSEKMKKQNVVSQVASTRHET